MVSRLLVFLGAATAAAAAVLSPTALRAPRAGTVAHLGLHLAPRFPPLRMVAPRSAALARLGHVCMDAAEPAAEEKPKLTLKIVAEMVETTFVRSCMDLATGQIDSLKLFIVAAKAGFELGAAMHAMELALDMCETNTANRELMAEESELRALWCSLVYLTLERVDHPAAGVAGFGAAVGKTVAPPIRCKYEGFVREVVEARQRGEALSEIKLQGVLSAAGMEAGADATETAVLSQSLRLVYLTLTVLEEEEAVTKPADEPKPFIPGTD